MTSGQAHSVPSEVVAEAGDVIIDGPGGVALTLSPDAAEETGRRLLQAADQARCQREAPRDSG